MIIALRPPAGELPPVAAAPDVLLPVGWPAAAHSLTLAPDEDDDLEDDDLEDGDEDEDGEDEDDEDEEDDDLEDEDEDDEEDEEQEDE
jgi:hypothetical protein